MRRQHIHRAVALIATTQQLEHMQKAAGFFDGLGQAVHGGWDALKGVGNSALATVSRPFQQMGAAWDGAAGGNTGGYHEGSRINNEQQVAAVGQAGAGATQFANGAANAVGGAGQALQQGMDALGQWGRQGAQAVGQFAHQAVDATGRAIQQGAQAVQQGAQAARPYAEAAANVAFAPAALAYQGAQAFNAGAGQIAHDFSQGWNGGQSAPSATAAAPSPAASIPHAVNPQNQWQGQSPQFGGQPVAGVPRAGVVGPDGSAYGGGTAFTGGMPFGATPTFGASAPNMMLHKAGAADWLSAALNA